MLRFVTILMLCAFAKLSFGQNTAIEPVAILDHEYQLKISDLLEISAYEVAIDKIDRKRKANRVYKGILEDLDSLSPDSEPDEEQLYEALKQAVEVAHFYGINNQLSQAPGRLNKIRSIIVNLGNQLGAVKPENDRTKIGRYYSLIAQFGQSKGKGSAVTELLELKKVIGNKVVNANIDLLVGYSLILSTSTKAQGAPYLKRPPSSSVFGRIAHRLTVVLMESGVDGDGQVYQGASPKFKKDLKYLLNIAKGAPRGVQNHVLDTAFFIWKARDPELEEPLFSFDAFKGLKPTDAFIESKALQSLRSKEYKKSIRRYESISSFYVGSDQGYRIDKRIWKMHLKIYVKGKDLADLKTAFSELWKKYEKSKDPGAVQFRRDIKQDFKKITLRLIVAGAKSNTAAAVAIDSTKFLLPYMKSRKESYNFKLRYGQLLFKTKKYEQAVSVFMDLTKDNPSKNFPFAIKAQSKLANWPIKPPWLGQIPTGDRKQRLKLLSVYDSASKEKTKESRWLYLSQMGLLYRALGNKKSAESLWMKFLQNAKPNNKLAMEAAGVLFNEFYQSKQWIKLVNLGYMALKNKFAMTFQLKPVAFQKPFSEALFTQGQNDIRARNLDRATKYLADFIKYFANDPRIPQAYHGLGTSYKGLNKLIPALNAYKILAEKHPKYPARKNILLNGGEWAISNKKTIEYAFFFYGRYLNDYPQETNIPQIRERLAQIYLNQKLYGWASRLYKQQSLAPNVSPQAQLNAAIKFLEIEEKYGQPKDAAFGANRILQLARPDSPSAGKAYGFLAKYAVARNDIKEMKALEPKLLAISKSSKDAREALGMMKFKMAQIFTKPIRNNEANAFLKDPEGAIKGYFDLFNQEKGYYESVCRIGMTESCAPSMFKLVTLAETAIIAIRDVEIASTLGASRVNAFKVFKQLHLSKLEQAAKFYAQNALKLARQGTTSPMWKTEIVKSLGNKTNFGIGAP